MINSVRKTIQKQSKDMNGSKWIFFLSSIIWAIVVGVISFEGHAIYQNEVRAVARHEALLEKIKTIELDVVAIKANRFTSKDAQELTEAILQNIPPKWFLDDVKDLDERVRLLELKLRR